MTNRIDEIKARQEAYKESMHDDDLAFRLAYKNTHDNAPADIAYLLAEVERLERIIEEQRETLANHTRNRYLYDAVLEKNSPLHKEVKRLKAKIEEWEVFKDVIVANHNQPPEDE